MHPRTKATLEQLEKADWFVNVGTYIGVEDRSKFILLSSWQEAIKSCSSIEWENLLLEASNQYCERLVERSKERFNQWNDIATELKETTIPFVRRKIEAVVREHNLPKVFEDIVQWDILGVCMEAEYADVYPPGFYASQAYWYVRGHFPCGWEGEFPKGKLIIY
ncbi:MAG: hypothetical protein RMJ56_00245 [Gemmataceae bacterium]|nr:hypothetical protein [Gemmata sp.]MDW8196009.1 hypothetical protein [Gemmataceae bacterium]